MTVLPLLLFLAQAGGVYTEDEAVERALRESPDLKAREYEVEAAQALTDVARRWENPQLRISGLRYDRLVDPAVDGRSYSDHPFEKTSIGLRWSPPALGQRGTRQAEAKTQKVEAEAERAQAKRDTVARVRRLFATVVNLDAQIALAKATIAQREKLRGLVKQRLERQAATRVDLSLVEMELLDAQSFLSEFESGRRQAYDGLLVHLGLPPGQAISLSVPQGEVCKAVSDTDSLIQHSERTNPWSGLLQAKMDAADVERSRTWQGLVPWPDFLQLSYVMADDNSPGYYSFQLGLSLPLFDWKRAERRHFSARQKRFAAEFVAENRALADKVRETASLQMAQAALVKRYQESAAVVEEGLSHVQRSLDAGDTTNLVQVLELQSRLLLAQKARLRAQLECKRREIELDRLTGRGAFGEK